MDIIDDVERERKEELKKSRSVFSLFMFLFTLIYFGLYEGFYSLVYLCFIYAYLFYELRIL